MKSKHPSGRPIKAPKTKALPIYRNVGEGNHNDRLNRAAARIGFLARSS